MNTSRRVWQILLPVVLLLSVLASCGSKEEVHWQKTATYTAATMSGTTGTEVQSTSSSSSSSALTEVTTAKPNETEPPTEYIYVNGADEIKLEDVAAMFTVDDIDLSAQMGYVTHKSGDIYAGKEEWFEFVRLVEEGTPAVVRVVSFFYADKSGSKDEVYVDDLTFNGLNFIYKHYYSGTESPAIYFRYLQGFDAYPMTNGATYEKGVIYVLSNRKYETWEQVYNDEFGGEVVRQIWIYKDYTYKEEYKDRDANYGR